MVCVMGVVVTEQGLFAFVGLISMMTMFVLWLLFARISMARIERDMKDDGVIRPCPWDGIGGRAVWYAFAIGLPISAFNPRHDPLIDVPLVRQYAKPIDSTLGLMLVISGAVCIAFGLSGALVFDFY